jgi:hypothetical protein
MNDWSHSAMLWQLWSYSKGFSPLSYKAHKMFLNELLCSSLGSNSLSACHTVTAKSVVCSMQVFTGVKIFTTESDIKIKDSLSSHFYNLNLNPISNCFEYVY